MRYRDLTVESSSWIKRFSHQRRFEIANRLLAVRPTDRVLDVGAGDGYFVRMLSTRHQQVEIVAYDPSPSMRDELAVTLEGTHVAIVDDEKDLPRRGFSRISCLEVFEHLLEDDQLRLLALIGELLAPAGKVVLSVPIEIGLSGAMKNLVRLAIGKPHFGATPKNILRSTFGLYVDRRETYRRGHIGFDYRSLAGLVKSTGWVVGRMVCSPIPVTGRLLNSQIFYVLHRSE